MKQRKVETNDRFIAFDEYIARKYGSDLKQLLQDDLYDGYDGSASIRVDRRSAKTESVVYWQRSILTAGQKPAFPKSISGSTPVSAVTGSTVILPPSTKISARPGVSAPKIASTGISCPGRASSASRKSVKASCATTATTRSSGTRSSRRRIWLKRSV